MKTFLESKKSYLNRPPKSHNEKTKLPLKVVQKILKKNLFLVFTTGRAESNTGSASVSGDDWMADLPVVLNPLLVVLEP